MPASHVPAGCKDAKWILLLVTAFGDLLQGGITFGWNALSLMIKQDGNFASDTCDSQENRLALVYILGVFATNFGAALIGPVLDRVGPRLTACCGCVLNSLGIVLMGLSSSSKFNAFIPAAILIGFGGLMYHLSLFSTTSLFPHHRGLVSASYVAAYTGSAAVYIIWKAVYDALGGSHDAYRFTLVVYGVACLMFVPLAWWINPRKALHVGQVYLMSRSWRFHAANISDLQEPMWTLGPADKNVDAGAPAFVSKLNSQKPPIAQMECESVSDDSAGSSPDSLDSATTTKTLPQAASGTAVPPVDPCPAADHEAKLESNLAQEAFGNAPKQEHTVPPVAPAAGKHKRVTLREPRRFMELKRKPFLRQLASVEFIGLTAFFCLNVFILQFYLGTARIQLEDKGDLHHDYISIINIVSALGMVAFPLAGWLLDSNGYALALTIINALNVASSVLQAVPNLPLQILQFILWSICRFLMYALYYTFIGSLFGFYTFGKLIGVTNVVNGIFGLVALPLSRVALSSLRHRFWILNMTDALVLLPLFALCVLMWRWERRDIVEHDIDSAHGDPKVGPLPVPVKLEV